MLAVNLIKEQGKKTEVGVIHYAPFDPDYGLNMTEEELLAAGFILVESVPVAEDNGKMPTLYFNDETGEFFYEYKERELTEDEILRKDSAESKAKISALEDLTGQLIMEIAMLKGGL